MGSQREYFRIRRVVLVVLLVAIHNLLISSKLQAQTVSGQIFGQASTLFDGETVSSGFVGGPVIVEIPNSGEDSAEVLIPSTPLTGNAGEPPSFSFIPSGAGEVTLNPEGLTLRASAGLTLSNPVPANNPPTYSPSSQMQLTEFFMGDGILIFPEDSNLHGQAVLFDLFVDVGVSMELSVGSSSGSIASAVGSYEISTETGGVEESFEGTVRRTINLGEVVVTTDEEGAFTGTKTVSLPTGRAILGPSSQGDINEFNNFGFNFSLESNVYGSGPRGSAFDASVELSLSNLRISNVRFQESQQSISIETLTSLSRSGFDYLGNGEPEGMDPEDGHRWVNAAGGLFATAANWDDFNNNEIQDDVPETDDTAIFDLPAAYTVDVGTQVVDRLIVGGDPSISVSFTNADLRVNGVGLDPAAVTIDNGNFKLLGGTINSVHSRVSEGAATTVEVNGSSSDWNNTGKFTLGDGDVEVRAVNGGRFDLEEVIVGESDTGSLAEVRLIAREFGSSIEMGNAQVGKGGAGYLRAEAGGAITGEEVRIGVGSGALGRLASVGREPSGTSPSTVELETLYVGYSGFGQAFVNDGGEMNAGKMIVGLFDVGSVTVENPGSVLKAPFELSVGGTDSLGEEPQGDANAGSGELTITDGAKVVAGEGLGGEFVGISSGMNIGTISSGSVFVDGETGDTRPMLEVFGGLRVGNVGLSESPYFKGNLEISNGGKAKADGITIAVEEDSNGIITVTGENAARGDVSELEVTGGIEIGGYYFHEPASGLGKMVVEAGAEVSVEDDINIGTSNPGELEISGVRASNEDFSTMVSAFAIRAGRSRPGSIVVDDRSELRTNILALGVPYGTHEDEQPTGTLDVVDGGQLEVGSLFLNHGLAENASGSVIVEGTANLISATIAAGSIIVGPNSELQVLDQGQVETEDLTIEGGGEVFVEGDGGIGDRPARILVSNDLVMGGSFGNESFLGIDEDSEVEVQGDIAYTSGARMCIDGTLTCSEIFAAGFLELGCSLGTAVIDGDFTLGPTGVLEIEIWGSTPVDEHDTMIVTGDVDLQGTLHFVFKDYAPQQGETFAILDAAGSFSDTGSSVIYSGLKEGFEARYESIDGTMSLVAESNAELLDAGDPVSYNATLLSENGRANFTLFGESGFRYVFEFSTDLVEWIVLEEIEGSNGALYFDHGGSGAARQFYRVRRESSQ